MLNKTISYLVPVHNEEDGIGNFLQQLYATVSTLTTSFEIIVIDDGSADNTASILYKLSKHLPIKIIQLSRNFGKEAALTAGLEACAGDAAILIDADFQHPISLIPEFLQYWSNGYDMVYGVQEHRNNESKIKRWITFKFYQTMQIISKINIIPNAGDFRLLDKKVITALNRCPERNRFMKGLYAWVGFKSIGVPFVATARTNGLSSWNYKRLTELAITGITSFSDIPLRIWSFIGFIIALAAFFSATWILIKTLIFGIEVPGYASIIVAIFFFCGIQLLSIGILGEYIAKIFTEVKQRPCYIIANQSGF